MKKYLILFLAAVIAVTGCKEKDDPQEDVLNDVKISLSSNGSALTVSGINVSLSNTATSVVYSAETNAEGTVEFKVPAGLYEAKASSYVDYALFNGVNSSINVVEGAANAFTLEMVESHSGQVLIKELYYSGCYDEKTQKSFSFDRYLILYNNSPVEADITDAAIGMAYPANGHASNLYRNEDGSLSYTDFIPAWQGLWYFKTEVKIAPYSQTVISITGAKNHTETVPASVDLRGADYVFYNPEVLSLDSYYPIPDSSIPTSHYMDINFYGMGKAWALSLNSPALILVIPEGTNIKDFTSNPDNRDVPGGKPANTVAKIPVDWVKDAVEIFDGPSLDNSAKRLLPAVDAGFIAMPATGKGYSVYRNVDKEATEAIEGNKEKLVYNYAGGTEDPEINGNTDPSGIDAEASIANGAIIIYKDTNNSTSDFHIRKVASIKK